MSLDKHSLSFRLIAPSFLIISVVFISLIVLVSRVSNTIQEDYSRFGLSAVNSEVQKILATAASELTAAHLSENVYVTEVKQKSVLDELAHLWQRMEHDGIVVNKNGAVLISTLAPERSRTIVTSIFDGYFVSPDSAFQYRAISARFPLWDWRVVTVKSHTESLMTRSGAGVLLPLVFIGCILMLGGISLVIKRALKHPMNTVLAGVRSGQEVKWTGVTELDIIGGAVNDAFSRLLEKQEQLHNELRERERIERDLREKDAQINRLLSCTEEGIYGIDPDGNCTFCNLSCLTLLGYEHEEQLLGRNMHELAHHSRPDGTPYPNHECDINIAFREMKNVHIDNEVFWRTDGSSFPVEFWSHPIYENGTVSGAVVTFIDISQRKLLEDQLIQAQKMESIGRLAGGVAHDFNNLLTPIIGYSEFLLQDLAANNDAVAKVERVLKAAGRAQDLVHQLLSFSRKQVLEMKVIDLNQTLLAFQDILRRTIRESITIRVHLAEESYGVRADKNLIDQIIMNLVVNAQDAIGESGEITIETALVLLDDEYASQHAEIAPGRFFMMAVSDNGCGMDRETKQRIFEPFFTTKGVGKGTGLGLATVYGIVRQHGGNIWVYSEPGKGTTFKVYFPIVSEAPQDEQLKVIDQVVVRQDRPKVLVVEDNEMVRVMVNELLIRQGYDVTALEDPVEALRIIDGRQSLDMLIADVVMPEMNGHELYARLAERYPGLKVLYMSGYTTNVIVHHGILDEGIHFIQKPFATSAFARKVDEILK